MKIDYKRVFKLFFYFLLVLVIEYVFTIAVFLLVGFIAGISFLTSQDNKVFEMSESRLILAILIILAAPIAYNVKHGMRDYKNKDSAKVFGYILVSVVLIYFNF
jgi:hypothetical protein